jgi:hypothetical protein
MSLERITGVGAVLLKVIQELPDGGSEVLPREVKFPTVSVGKLKSVVEFTERMGGQ